MSVALSSQCVSYGRVSLDEQKIGKGVASQHNENDDYGLEIGHPVTRRYEDIGISAFGLKRERPGYQELLRDIAAGRIGIVIVWHADRLTRDVGEGREFIKLCLAHGVRLFSMQRGGEYNFRRAAGRADFLRDIVKAEEESGHKGERVSLSHKRRALAGEWGGGVRPYGWGVDTGRVRSRCVNPKADIADRVYEDRPVLDMTQHRPNERDEIRRWKDDLLAGVSMNQILRDINTRELPTVSTMEGRTVKRGGKNILGQKWSRQTVVGILTNPRVAGHAVWQGEIVRWGAFKPIITEEERQALVTLFRDPSRRTASGNTPKWLGSLIYRCGQCDGGLMRQRLKRQSDGTPLYLCSQCNKGRQSAVLLDAYVEKVIIERLSRPDVIDLIAPSTPAADLDALRDERAALHQRKRGLSLMYADGEIDDEQLASGTTKIRQRLSEIDATLSEAVGESPLAPFALARQSAAETWAGMTLGRRREIVRILVDVRVMQAPARNPGRKLKDAPPEKLDTATIIIKPKQ
ncbi:recombinase family protein [Streptomyces sp. NPDC049887]|uniref:recombinase family protein n=1 Tax=Streptomyces sp. NPDC049887 TaxID=3155654 RepID=UPI00342EEAA3